MRFDALIIGGGLAGLICGNRLQQKGVRCAIIATGQSALYFSSGSFDLLNHLADGTKVDSPTDAVKMIDQDHPYAKLGDRFTYYANEAKALLQACGIETVGNAECNHHRITPMGALKPTWLTLANVASLSSKDELQGKKLKVFGIAGFLDFNASFIADGLEEYAAECQTASINLPELELLRTNPTEMRSTNIARALENDKTIERLIAELTERCTDVDAVVLPALFGLTSMTQVEMLKEQIDLPLWFVPTMPPSVPGIYLQQQLRRAFELSGGTYLAGDTAIRAEFGDDKVKAVYSANHGTLAFNADNFILAAGSYISNGLVAQPDKIIEPLFNSDIAFAPDRNEWYDTRFFNKQNYISFGVTTDEMLRIKIGGRTQQNLYAIGSILGGFNAIDEGCGAGVAMLTALYVADQLINKG